MTLTEMTISTPVWNLDHDFNKGRNEAGFHEVVLPTFTEALFRTDDIVIVTDDDIRVRGRIRCLIAVVEEVPE